MYLKIKPNTDADKNAEEQSMKEFCKTVFPDFETNFVSNGNWPKAHQTPQKI